jgi:hypothetical protein
MRFDVKYSLTEKCENCITAEPLILTTAIKLEQVDSTISLGFSGRQFSSNVRLPPSSDLNVRNPASSSTRSGCRATTIHWKSRRAYSQLSSSMSSNVRSYVSSNVSGSSSRARRIRGGRQRRNLSNWQNAHLNLYDDVNEIEGHPQRPTQTLTFHQLFLKAFQ